MEVALNGRDAGQPAITSARHGLDRSRGRCWVGTPVRGGATYREAHLAMEILADHGRLLSFEIVEVNPVIDEHNGRRTWRWSWLARRLGRKF